MWRTDEGEMALQYSKVITHIPLPEFYSLNFPVICFSAIHSPKYIFIPLTKETLVRGANACSAVCGLRRWKESVERSRASVFVMVLKKPDGPVCIKGLQLSTLRL